MSCDQSTGASGIHSVYSSENDNLHPSESTSLDLVAYVHGRLLGADLPELARQLGYNNVVKGAKRLYDLATQPILGLDEAVGNFDLRFTTIELLEALCRLDIHDETLLASISDKCHELRAFYQKKSKDLSITQMKAITEYPPMVTSWSGGMLAKAKLVLTCPPFTEDQAPGIWLGLIKRQITTHFQQYGAPSPIWGQILGYEYIYCQDEKPIKFDTNGTPIGSQTLLISRCSTILGEPVAMESIQLNPLAQ